MSVLIAMPAAASEMTLAPKAKNTQVSLRQIAAREAAKTTLTTGLTTGTAVRRAEQPNTSRQSTGFFKSRPGAIALVVMAAGTGYAIYSASHDRIKSPAKN